VGLRPKWRKDIGEEDKRYCVSREPWRRPSVMFVPFVINGRVPSALFITHCNCPNAEIAAMCSDFSFPESDFTHFYANLGELVGGGSSFLETVMLE